MPLKGFKIKDDYKSTPIYQMYGYRVDVKTGKKIPDSEMRIKNETDVKEKLKKRIPLYKSSWNTDRKDGTIWKFVLREIGNQDLFVQDKPLNKIKDYNGSLEDLRRIFKTYMEEVYGTDTHISTKPYYAQNKFTVSINVPGTEEREDFTELMTDFCKEYGCSFSYIDQAPGAPSRQYFSKPQFLYPLYKNYESLKKNESSFNTAKRIFKEQWNQEFDESKEEDREDLLLLWNEYRNELREWIPVELNVYKNPSEKIEREEDYNTKQKIKVRYYKRDEKGKVIVTSVDWKTGLATIIPVEEVIRRSSLPSFTEMYPELKIIEEDVK